MKKIFDSVAAVKRYYKSGKTAYHLNCTELGRGLLNAAYSYGLYGHAKYWVYRDAMRMQQSHPQDFWEVIDRGFAHPEFRENTISVLIGKITTFTIKKIQVKFWDEDSERPRTAVCMSGPQYGAGVYVVVGEELDHYDSVRRSEVVRFIKNACCYETSMSHIRHIIDWDLDCDLLDEALNDFCRDEPSDGGDDDYPM